MNDCYLKGNCPCQTGSCYGDPDEGCPVYRYFRDLIMKEQEAIPVDTKVIVTFNGDVEVYCCRNCRLVLDPTFHYCPNCGRQVKWDA